MKRCQTIRGSTEGSLFYDLILFILRYDRNLFSDTLRLRIYSAHYTRHTTFNINDRTELVEHIYDQDFDRDSNTIEVFIGRLRKKMGMDLIKTERGYGYRLSIERE